MNNLKIKILWLRNLAESNDEAPSLVRRNFGAPKLDDVSKN